MVSDFELLFNKEISDFEHTSLHLFTDKVPFQNSNYYKLLIFLCLFLRSKEASFIDMTAGAAEDVRQLYM